MSSSTTGYPTTGTTGTTGSTSTTTTTTTPSNSPSPTTTRKCCLPEPTSVPNTEPPVFPIFTTQKINKLEILPASPPIIDSLTNTILYSQTTTTLPPVITTTTLPPTVLVENDCVEYCKKLGF